MTRAEQAEIERAAPPGTVLSFRPHGESDFVRLSAGPCPLLAGTNTCTVYAVRPYNCRRYGCLRDDVTTEPWQDGWPEPKTREQRRSLVVLQRHGQRWARSHGWTED
jgi:Fe-S-cluster containining protein